MQNPLNRDLRPSRKESYLCKKGITNNVTVHDFITKESHKKGEEVESNNNFFYGKLISRITTHPDFN